MEIRAPHKDEKDQWLPLWNGYLNFYEAQPLKEVTNQTWLRFFDEAEPVHMLAAFDEAGDMTGFVNYQFHRSTWAIGYYCYLEDLFVNPAFRGKGIARKLILAVREAAKTKQCDRVYWVTQESNQ